MVLMLFASLQNKGLVQYTWLRTGSKHCAQVIECKCRRHPSHYSIFFPRMIFSWQALSANQPVLSPYQHPLKAESRINLIYQKSAETITCAGQFKFRLAHNQVFLTVLRAHTQEPARKASNSLRGYEHRAFSPPV